MTQEELLRRQPVWDSMSDLFLDTENRWFVPRVARSCARSGYDDETLERIFWAEVFPEAIENLLQVAGDWAMLTLDEKALIRRANHCGVPWLTRRAHGWMVEKKWLAVRQVTGWLRDLADEEQDLRVRALDLLGRRFFETPDRESIVATPVRIKELLLIVREEWARYEPLCRALLGEGDPSMPADACSEAVRRLLAK